MEYTCDNSFSLKFDCLHEGRGFGLSTVRQVNKNYMIAKLRALKGVGGVWRNLVDALEDIGGFEIPWKADL